MITFKKQANKDFSLDSAITELFGLDADVSKICNFHTSGTVEVQGKAYDWVMTVNSFNFMEA